MNSMKQILIVEDDKALSIGITLALRSDELVFKQAYTFEEAMNLWKKENFSLVILDVNLPDGNGFDILQNIRAVASTPVILLTANDMETDIVTGLEMGADDYITKPFSLMVLRARVNTQLRKVHTTPSSQIIIDDFTFDFTAMRFMKGNNVIELSKTEQRLLRLLIENRGITLSRAELVDRIWTDGSEYVDENALSVTVKRLRDKIEGKEDKGKYIRTVYGIGYTWGDRL